MCMAPTQKQQPLPYGTVAYTHNPGMRRTVLGSILCSGGGGAGGQLLTLFWGKFMPTFVWIATQEAVTT